MSRLLLFALTVGIGSAVAGCSERVILPTWCTSVRNCVDVELGDAPQGVLHGQGGCIWLAAEKAEYRIEWPSGYTARTNPFEVLNADGVTVAREGNFIRFNAAEPGPADNCGRTLRAIVSFGAGPFASP